MNWGRRSPRLGRALCLALALGCVCAAPAGADFYISSPSTSTIFSANLNGSGLATLLSGAPFGAPGLGGIAVGDGHIYWTWEDGIGRANLDGSGAEKEFITGINGITGVTVNENHVYWSGGGGNVGRANVNGSEVEPHFITGIPGGAVDGVAVNSEFIYWTNFWNSAIGRAKLDGSAVEQEWVLGTHTPEGLAVGPEYVYWAITYENHIGRAKLDGSELTTNFITTGLSSNGNEDVGLTVYGQHIYWVNPTTGTVGRANLNGTEIEPEFITEAGSPLGITVLGSPGSPNPAGDRSDVLLGDRERERRPRRNRSHRMRLRIRDLYFLWLDGALCTLARVRREPGCGVGHARGTGTEYRLPLPGGGSELPGRELRRR